MRQRSSYIVFGIFLAVILLISLGGNLAPGRSLYLVQIEDPVPRLSFYPWLVHSAHSFREGFFPLWNHLSGTGFPHLANYQSSPLNPLKWPYYLYPSLRVLDVMVLLRLALMGLFTFMFLRRLKLAPLAAGAGAIAFALSGYMMKHVNQINISTEMWIPLSLYLLHGQLRHGPTLRRFLISGLVSGVAFLGGNPEAAFYFVVINVLYGLFMMRFSKGVWIKDAFCIFGPFLLGGILASCQLLPFIEYLGPGWHIHTEGLHLVAAHSPKYFYSLLMPWLFGPHGSYEFQIFTLPYIGLITFLFAMTAIFHIRKTPRSLFFFLAFILVFLALIYRIPPFGWIAYLPVFNQSGNVKFAMAGVSFCFACTAGMGIDLVMKGGLEKRNLTVALGLITGLVFLLIGVAFLDSHTPGPVRQGWLYQLVILLVCGFILVLLRRKPSPSPGYFPVFSSLMVFELLILTLGFRPQSLVDNSRWRFKDPVPPTYMADLAKGPIPDRFLADGTAIHHSLNILYGLNDLRAFEGMYPRDYVSAMGRIEGFSMEKSVDAFFSHGWSFDVRPGNMGHPLLDLLGVKYAFLSDPPDMGGWSLKKDDIIKTYENTEAFPRAFMAHDLSEPINPVVEDQIEVLNYSAERVELKVDCPGYGHLILTDTYFPGWQARLDGNPVRIEKAAELVRAVPVSRGRHIIEMRYEPWGFRLGLWISIVSLIFIFILLVIRRKSHSKVISVE